MRWIAAALAASALTGCAALDDVAPRESGGGRLLASLNPFGPPIAYEVAFESEDGDLDPDLIETLTAASRAAALQRGAAPDALSLRRRAKADEAALVRGLRSEGYFDGAVRARVETGDDTPRVVYVIAAGERFVLADHVIAPIGDPPLRLPAPSDVGGPARSASILAAERRALRAARDAGRPYARLAERDARANFDDDALRVVSRVDLGPRVEIGAVRIAGAERTRRDFLEGFAADLVGRPASATEIAEVERLLVETRLFRAVKVRLPEARPAADGAQPLTIEVVEAPPRTIGGGVRYSTADGPGAQGLWEHRNLFGRGERFRIEIDAAFTRQGVDLMFRKPRVGGARRAFIAELDAANEENDAFDRLGAEGAFRIEEHLSEHLFGAVGLAYDVSRVDGHDDGGVDDALSVLIGAPLTLRYDDADDALNPTRGVRARFETTPWTGFFDDMSVAFVETELIGSAYRDLGTKRVVAAGRLRLATVAGESFETVPANRRVFAGGGGSVRAYATRFVGPLDGGEPTGGLTAAEAALEFRLGVTEEIGVVPFIEAGVVKAEPFEIDLNAMQYGFGLGFRYLSPAGPLRVDVAAPIDRRDQDDLFQLYFSIGQAF